MYTLATLTDLRRHLGLADDDTSADSDLLKALQQASHIIESLTNRRYCPHVENRIASVDRQHPTTLILPDDLLSLTAITNGDGSTITLSDVERVPALGDVPASVLVLVNGMSFSFATSALNALSVDGVWGWHDRWSQAWRDSGDTVQDNPLSAGTTTLTVTDADGVDADGFAPRFQVGHLLQIDSEYMRVIGVDTATNQLTVLRGVQGTSAVSHAQQTTIAVYHPVPAVRQLCVTYAELLYKSLDVVHIQKEPMVRRLRRMGA